MNALALQIIETLRAAGFEAYLVGGAARDLLMGGEPHDYDIATNAPPDDVRGLFPKTIAVGARFGVIVVVQEDQHFEVATFRSDGAYLDGRRPVEVHFSSAEEDAKRRDFTINGLMYDPLEERWLDFVGGRRDLELGLIRAIGDPGARFAEDHLRLLRAVRFATRFNFQLEPETLAAIRTNAATITNISAERIGEELTKIICGPRAGQAIRLLHDCGLLEYVLPEIAAMDGVEQPPEFHPEGDVLTHTCLMLDLLNEPTPALAWGALLHDVGKPPCFRVAERIRFDGHCERGAEMALEIGHRMRLSGALTERIAYLVRHHLRINTIPEMRPARRIRFMREEPFAELLELLRLDSLGSGGTRKNHDVISVFYEAELAKGPPRAPLLTGRDLIELGLSPGPLFGEILEAAETEQLEGRLTDSAAALAWVKERFL